MVRRYSPAPADIDSLIEPVLVLSGKFLELEQEMIPSYFWPKTGKWGIKGKIFLYLTTYVHSWGNCVGS
jgi:phenol 2-monooxygenase